MQYLPQTYTGWRCQSVADDLVSMFTRPMAEVMSMHAQLRRVDHGLRRAAMVARSPRGACGRSARRASNTRRRGSRRSSTVARDDGGGSDPSDPSDPPGRAEPRELALCSRGGAR